MFHRSRASNSEVNIPIWPEIKLVVFVTCKFDEDPIKMKSQPSGQHFPHYKSVGVSIKALSDK